MAKPPRTGTDTAEKPEVKRRPDGTFAPDGPSANPGGLSREYREMRRWCQEKGPRLRQRIEKWLESADYREARTAMEWIFLRGYGVPAKASELPETEESPLPTPEECNTQALLTQTRALMARGVASLARKGAAGELGAEELAALGRVGHSLGELLKAEKEAEARSGLAEKSTEELLSLVPVEVLAAHLSKRAESPESRESVAAEGAK